MLKILNKIIFLIFILFSPLIHTEERPIIIESDWLDLSIGSHGNVLGAEVQDVDHSPETNSTVLEITIPIDNIESLETFEKIQIIEKKSRKPIPQISKTERMTDYENGIYGLRLHIKKIPGLEFQLKLIDSDNKLSD